MFTPSADLSQNGGVRSTNTPCSAAEIEEYEFSRLLDKPRTLNMERQRSFDELSIGMSPHPAFRNFENNSFRFADYSDAVFSPGRRSGFNTPRSQNGFETHPMVADAWETLRRALVYFRGQPVGTIAALDNSDEKLNYDQVNPQLPCYNVLEP